MSSTKKRTRRSSCRRRSHAPARACVVHLLVSTPRGPKRTLKGTNRVQRATSREKESSRSPTTRRSALGNRNKIGTKRSHPSMNRKSKDQSLRCHRVLPPITDPRSPSARRTRRARPSTARSVRVIRRVIDKTRRTTTTMRRRK